MNTKISATDFFDQFATKDYLEKRLDQLTLDLGGMIKEIGETLMRKIDSINARLDKHYLENLHRHEIHEERITVLESNSESK